MNIAILCPGRSLHQTWPAIGRSRKYDEIIVLTTAVDADADATIWCAVDKIPKQLRQKAIDRGLERWENTKKTGYGKLSFFQAVVRASWRGAKRIDIYGHDMLGDCNYDAKTGEPIEPQKGEHPKGGSWSDRWEREKKGWNRLKAEMARKGVEINEVRDIAARP